MKIIPEKKALLLRLRNPNLVKTLIPKARDVMHEGKQYVAVPHQVEVVQVLRNIGIAAPSPIGFYYGWPGRFKPFDHQKTIAEFLTLHNRAFNLSDLGCVDADTEYLSPTGWKRIADYDGGLVAQYHPDSESAEFVEPTEFVKLPCDEMIRVKTKYGVDQLLSPEHRMVIRDRLRPHKVEVVQAAELMLRQENWIDGIPMPKPYNRKLGTATIAYSGATVPTTFFVRTEGEIALSDAELRVQVAVIADGHFSNQTRRCVVRLKKLRKKERLRALLADAGITWREREQNTATATGFTVFSFDAPLRIKVFDHRFWGASFAQLLVIRDEVWRWDGTDRAVTATSGKGYSFSSSIKESADFVQYAFAATGMPARVSVQERTGRGRVEQEFTVTARLNGNRHLALKGSSGAGEKYRSMSIAPSTDGFKYCFMVPSTFLVLRRNGCVFCTGNTGKTVATLWAYDYLKARGIVHKALVVSPLSTLERTWADTVFEHFPHLETSVVFGSRDRRLKMLDLDADIYLINHDGIKVSGIVDALAKRPDIDLIIVDEIAQVGRSAGTERFKRLNAIINKQVPRRAWGLTGTPIPNTPTDAWAQCRLLVPEKVPPYFNRFRDMVMRQVSQFAWVSRDNALEVVQEVMQPAIRFHRDECIDLPPCMYEFRQAPLTTEQSRAYKDMLVQLRTEVDSGEVTAVNEAVKAQKLIQIACGVAYGNDGGHYLMDAGPRIDVVMEVINESASKVIVFVPFVAVVEMVAKEIADRIGDDRVMVIHGGVGKTARDQIFGSFQKSTDFQVLVAQPAAMSHGLTLTAASTIIWYAPITSNDTFEQANARITRPGQKHSQLIVMVEGTEIERRYYTRLKEKQRVQGLFLDLVKNDRLT